MPSRSTETRVAVGPINVWRCHVRDSLRCRTAASTQGGGRKIWYVRVQFAGVNKCRLTEVSRNHFSREND